jgi:hypothetical protein
MSTVKQGIVAACLVCAAFVVLAVVVSARQAEKAGPWNAGRCYRASFLDPAQQQTLRVLEDPAGTWVRVQSDPTSPRVPGAAPRARVWLNTATVFAITEIECSSLPAD